MHLKVRYISANQSEGLSGLRGRLLFLQTCEPNPEKKESLLLFDNTYWRIGPPQKYCTKSVGVANSWHVRAAVSLLTYYSMLPLRHFLSFLSWYWMVIRITRSESRTVVTQPSNSPKHSLTVCLLDFILRQSFLFNIFSPVLKPESALHGLIIGYIWYVKVFGSVSVHTVIRTKLYFKEQDLGRCI